MVWGTVSCLEDLIIKRVEWGVGCVCFVFECRWGRVCMCVRVRERKRERGRGGYLQWMPVLQLAALVCLFNPWRENELSFQTQQRGR